MPVSIFGRPCPAAAPASRQVPARGKAFPGVWALRQGGGSGGAPRRIAARSWAGPRGGGDFWGCWAATGGRVARGGGGGPPAAVWGGGLVGGRFPFFWRPGPPPHPRSAPAPRAYHWISTGRPRTEGHFRR